MFNWNLERSLLMKIIIWIPCALIYCLRIKWNKMQMLGLFYSQRVWTFCIFICSNHTAEGCLGFLICSFIPELHAVSCSFHFQYAIQFWELLKNSLGIVKIFGVGPNFPELIYTLLCPPLRETAIDIRCAPSAPIADVPRGRRGTFTFLQISCKQAVFSFINAWWS